MKALLFTMLLVACSSDEPAAKGEDTPPPVSVTPPTPGTDAAVFVRARVEGDRVVAEIVTRATPALSGAALRLSFPAWLRFERRDEASGWSAAAVHHTKVGPDREVILVDTVKGPGIGHAAPSGGESVLTTLYFLRDAQPPANAGALGFAAQRCELRDAEGKPVPVRFYDQPFTR